MDSKENTQLKRLKCELCGRAYIRYVDVLSVCHNLHYCCHECLEDSFVCIDCLYDLNLVRYEILPYYDHIYELLFGVKYSES